MSLFDYPRINFKGTLQLNPGTANNDDYAADFSLPAAWGPFAGATLALIDSKRVEARTYGMSDEGFIAWVQKAQTFDAKNSPGTTRQIIPAEWNYYGDMSSRIVQAKVIGVQTGPATDDPLHPAMGADLSFSGHITDVNSEGSPPATQFFIEHLELVKGDRTFISGTASKGASQWLNFYRNVNLTADAGAGAYVYHVIRKQAGTAIDLPGFGDPQIAGVIFRYYLYRVQMGASSNADIEALYEQGKANPATLEIVGTFAPLLTSETIVAGPTGRLMVSNTTPIPTPTATRNNGNNGLIALAPAVLAKNGDTVSADFVGTFPDYFQDGANPKFDFGPVSLVARSSAGTAVIGPVDYADTATGDRKGWIFDFDLSSNRDAQKVLADPSAAFTLVHPTIGDVLQETDYYVLTNQQALYAEQFGSGTEFLNQGSLEHATVSVYRRGHALSPNACPPITIWQYRSIPLQAPGPAEPIATDLRPGQPIAVDTRQPGNVLFTFTINDGTHPAPAGYPPASYGTFMFPPYVTNSPSISLRILPNDEDFSRYYVSPDAEEPVGNPLLTFAVVYAKVLRTYYLLYPAMNQIFPLNDEQRVAQQAQAILRVTEPALWMSSHYMPRTRDMSGSRRRLLRAWCRKVLIG